MGKKAPNNKRLKYSTGLLKRFQEIYFKKYNEHISDEKAVLELDFLATIVSLLLADGTIKK